MNRLPFLMLLLVPALVHAEPRTWRNADASASFKGEYVSHDAHEVRIRKEDGRVFSLQLERLHANDRNWLAKRDLPETPEPGIHPSAVFDTLCFGDTRKEVLAKLKASKMVESTIDETFFGRLGLNGTFRTRQQIGGLHCELYFDWSSSGVLDEISLQTQPLGADSYDSNLKDNWSELIKVLSQLHGRPLQSGNYPKRSELQDDVFLASHLWRLEDGGSVLLGTSMQTGQYKVAVRFTTEKLQPVRVP